ncbi:hypothetical protein [Sphingomonas sp. R86520]|uniref:hypothetical protein n=1 Tax=Sphingomonas sp. R86520 TaxID=3093859 RepID=UPI0036D257AE
MGLLEERVLAERLRQFVAMPAMAYPGIGTIAKWCGDAADRIEELEAALQPFAKAGEIVGESNGFSDFYVYRPAAGEDYAIYGDHLRRARHALALSKGSEG